MLVNSLCTEVECHKILSHVAGILYNCGELETNCSSCLGVSDDMGFSCGWCSDRCLIMEECTTTFSTTTDMCPLPRINSVQPNRGPQNGTTHITISGTDLGASFDDIIEIGLRDTDVVCNRAGEETYVVGRQIVCVTHLVTETRDYMLDVVIQRGSDGVAVSAPFSVEEPQVTGVDPTFGPKSGGIEVVVSGSSLNIGNTENTKVELNGINCVIRR